MVKIHTQFAVIQKRKRNAQSGVMLRLSLHLNLDPNQKLRIDSELIRPQWQKQNVIPMRKIEMSTVSFIVQIRRIP